MVILRYLVWVSCVWLTRNRENIGMTLACAVFFPITLGVFFGMLAIYLGGLWSHYVYRGICPGCKEERSRGDWHFHTNTKDHQHCGARQSQKERKEKEC